MSKYVIIDEDLDVNNPFRETDLTEAELEDLITFSGEDRHTVRDHLARRGFYRLGSNCIIKEVAPVFKQEWGVPSHSYSGPPPIPLNAVQCDHPRKYINSADRIKFWVCPDCKKDLGDA